LIPYENGPLLIGHGWLFHPILEYATNLVEHAGTHPNTIAYGKSFQTEDELFIVLDNRAT